MKKSEVKIEDNSAAIKKELEAAIIRGLKAIGEEAEGYAKKDCPVDTGRLRASITYAVEGYQSAPGREAESGDSEKHGEPDKNSLVLGTNVEYAEMQEFIESFRHTSGKAHFLRDAISTHNKKYESIMKAALKAK